MSNSALRLQAISNFPEILDRNEIQTQKDKKRSLNSRNQNKYLGNNRSTNQVSGAGTMQFNSQHDMRSTITSQKDQINGSRFEEVEQVQNENAQNKSSYQEDQFDQRDKNKSLNSSQHFLNSSKQVGSGSVSNLHKNPLKNLFAPSSYKQNPQLNNFYFVSQRNTPKSSADKRSFFQSNKSKSSIQQINLVRRKSDINLKLQSTRLSQIINSPNSNDASSPQWNKNYSQLNSINPSDSYMANKQGYELVKSQNIKLQKNYEYLKDQILQALVLLEEEFRKTGKRESDFKKPMEIVQSLVNLLSDSAKNELKLAISQTQQQESQEQISQLKAQIDTLQTQLHHVIEENRSMYSLKSENEKEILKMNKQVLQQNKKIKADKKMIHQLERRLELILDTNFVEYANDRVQTSNLNSTLGNTSVPVSQTQFKQVQTVQTSNSTPAASSHNLRILLSELVKDNESLKKDNLALEIDILRLTDVEQRLNKKMVTLNNKIEAMKKKISAKDLEMLQQEEKTVQQNSNQELTQLQNSSNMLKRQIIPLDADFRINNLKFEYSQILMELIEHGSNNFALHVSRNKNGEKRTKLISLLANQFISYRDFGNRFVQTIQLLHEFEYEDDLIKIQQKVATSFSNIFKSEVTRLWICDSLTGVLYSYNSENKKINCLPGKGIFQDVIRGKLPINMKNQISNRYVYIQLNDYEDNFSIQLIQSTHHNVSQNYLNTQSSQVTQFNCMASFCLPIIIGEDVIGILEISDNQKQEGFTQDEELFGVVCANFLSVMIKKIKIQREQFISLKYNYILNDFFLQCLDSESLLILEKKIHSQVQELFGIEVCKFYFVKEASQIKPTQQIQQPAQNEANFSSFYSLVSNQAYSYKKGIIGQSITSMKPILINSIQQQNNFDPFVDLSTLLPTLTTPLFAKIEKNNTLQCVGVLQVPLKKRTHIAKEKDKFLLGTTPLVGVDTSLENQIKHYSTLVAQSIKFLQQKFEKQ